MRAVLLLGLSLFSSLTLLSPLQGQESFNLKELYHPRQVPLANVSDILEDGYGFIWLGGDEGLVRYDGNSYRSYFHKLGEQNSLPETRVNTLFLDSQNRLWTISNNQKISRYRYETDDFISYPFFIDGEQKISLAAENLFEFQGELWLAGFNGIYKYVEEKDEFQWAFQQSSSLDFLKEYKIYTLFPLSDDAIGAVTKTGGILLINLQTENVLEGTRFSGINQYKDKLGKPIYRAFYDEHDHALWISTLNGLGRYNIQENTWQFHRILPDRKKEGWGLCQDIYRLKDGSLLAGIEHGGVFRFDEARQQFQKVSLNLIQSTPINHPTIRSLFQDRGGVIWISMAQGSVYYSHPFLNQFHIFSSEKEFPLGEVRSFEQLPNEQLLVGIDGGGLIQIDLSSDEIVHLWNKQNKLLAGDGVTHILEIQQDVFWVCIWNFGIQEFKWRNSQLTLTEDRKQLIPAKNIHGLSRVSKDSVLVNNIDFGLSLYSPLEKEFSPINLSPNLPTTPKELWYATQASKAPSGDIWIQTSHHGVFQKTSSQLNYYATSTASASISNQSINTILPYDEDLVLLGSNSGLDIYIKEKKQFQHINSERGLPGRAVRALQLDQENRLWIYTEQGLSQVNLSVSGDSVKLEVENTYGNVLEEHGSGRSVSYMSEEGFLFFGDVNGMFYFHPDSLTTNTYVPPVVITDIAPLPANSPFTLDTIQSIQLASNQSMLKINFAALSYLLPEENTYTYKMEGLDKEWREAGTESQAIYTYLPSGKYTFKVRASNNHGKWNPTPTEAIIIVALPIWRKPWAIVAYLLITVGFMYGLFRYMQERRTLREEQEKLRTDNEVEKARLQLFTNISREFRTPLSLIRGPIEDIIAMDLSPALSSQVEFVRRNVDRLSQLANQALDIRNLQTGRISLKVSENDLVALSKEMVEEFEYLSEERNVSLKFFTLFEELKGWYDDQIVSYILFNVISNAFRDVYELGEIMIELRASEKEQDEVKQVEFIIRTDGRGLKQRENDSLQNQHSLNNGIGLELTTSLLKLHRGAIQVESGEGKGIIFYIQLPFSKEAYPVLETEVHSSNSRELLHSTLTPLNSINEPDIQTISQNPFQTSLPKLVLAIKDQDFRKYVTEKLQRHFQIQSFEDGQATWNEIEREIPDLVIADTQLPVIDGFTLCRKLKDTLESIHVPVILLTSHSSKEVRLQMLEAGSDAYFERPFDLDEFVSKSRGLVKQYQSMLKKLTNKPTAKRLNKKSISLEEDKFLSDLQESIRTHLHDPDFKVDALAEKMGISRVHLYRKIKELTGMSVSGYLREYQMKQAEELLLTGEKSISEVGFSLGFSSPSHFSRAFKAYSGLSPRAYLKQHTEA